jgi:transposase
MNFYLDILLNLANATVSGFNQHEDLVFLTVRFLNETSNCSYCGKESEEIKQTRKLLIRDLSVFGKAVYLDVPRRQFYCQSCQRYFTEKLSLVDFGRRYTQRYEEYIYKRVQTTSITEVSREEGLSWDQVKGIFDSRLSVERKETWEDTKRISIDEISNHKGHQDFSTVVSDIDRGKLIEVIDSHKQELVIKKIMEQPIEVREKVEEVSIDMWGGFPKVVKEVFPNAKIVYDRFHVMMSVNKELDKVRKKIGKNEKESRYILLKNREDLGDTELEKLEKILSRSKRLRTAYESKEEFRGIFERERTVEDGKREILKWIEKSKEIYCDSVKTIQNHLEGICNYFLNRTSSGVMEGINNRIKLIKRQAYGFLNFDNFRARLLACFSD